MKKLKLKAKKGLTIPPDIPPTVYVTDKNAFRYRAYQDSLGRYNNAQYNINLIRNDPNVVRNDLLTKEDGFRKGAFTNAVLHDKLKINPVRFEGYSENLRFHKTNNVSIDLPTFQENTKIREIYKSPVSGSFTPRTWASSDNTGGVDYLLPIYKKPVQPVEVLPPTVLPETINTPDPDINVDVNIPSRPTPRLPKFEPYGNKGLNQTWYHDAISGKPIGNVVPKGGGLREDIKFEDMQRYFPELFNSENRSGYDYAKALETINAERAKRLANPEVYKKYAPNLFKNGGRFTDVPRNKRELSLRKKLG